MKIVRDPNTLHHTIFGMDIHLDMLAFILLFPCSALCTLEIFSAESLTPVHSLDVDFTTGVQYEAIYFVEVIYISNRK